MQKFVPKPKLVSQTYLTSKIAENIRCAMSSSDTKLPALRPLKPPEFTPAPPNKDVSEFLSLRKTYEISDRRTRKTVRDILNYCRLEYENNCLFNPLQSVNLRATAYANVSETSLIRIKALPKQVRNENISRLYKKFRTRKSVLDDRDLIKIKDIFRNYYIKYRKIPTVKAGIISVANEIPTFQHSLGSLRKILADVGFKIQKLFVYRVLLEEHDAIRVRYEFLKTIKELRASAVNIFYVYECIIDKSLTLHKTFAQKYGYNEPLKDPNLFTIICAGSLDGFLFKSVKLIKNVENGVGFPSQMTHDTFINWLKFDLLPHLPPNSVVLMDSSPHHCVKNNKSLSYYSSKRDMCDFLNGKDIKCELSMRRSQLFKLVERNMEKRTAYIVDDTLNEHGHKAIRLPPHMIDFNLVQLIMDKVQQKLFKLAEDDYKFEESIGFVVEKYMTSIKSEEWQEAHEKVVNLEERYRKSDHEYDVAVDEIFINTPDYNRTESENDDFES